MKNKTAFKDKLYDFRHKFKTDTKFRLKTIAIGSSSLLLLIILIAVIIMIATPKPPVEPEVIKYQYNTKINLSDEVYKNEYKSITSSKSTEIDYISNLLRDYYNVGNYKDGDKIDSFTAEKYKAIKKLYNPKYSSSLQNIMVPNGKTVGSYAFGEGKNCLKDANGKCYTSRSLYIYDSFYKLPNKSTIITDVENFRKAVYGNLTGYNFKYPNTIDSQVYLSSSNVLVYYLNFRKINMQDSATIAAEQTYYEKLVEIYFDNFDKIDSKYRVATDKTKLTDGMTNYNSSKYQKYVEFTPMYYLVNGKEYLAKIEIQVDFVPKSVEKDYRSLVRDSTTWKKKDIKTIVIDLNDIWEALFRYDDIKFPLFQGDIINDTLIDYTNFYRNNEYTYLPAFDKNGTETITYPFKDIEIRYTYDELPELMQTKAKQAYDAYYTRALDYFSDEIREGASLTYTWDYVYNKAYDELQWAEDLRLNGFSLGIAVTVEARNSKNEVVASKIIEANKDVEISGSSIKEIKK